MSSKKERLLKDFGQMVADLQLLFRTCPSFTENERLFIENRLMFLQWEYHISAKRPIKIARRSKKDQSLSLKADPEAPLPSLEIFESRRASAGEELVDNSWGLDQREGSETDS
jgi:hypothetical protein